MGNVYENKCMLCKHYTDENCMDECKIYACGGSTGIAERLEGCSSFTFAYETQSFDVQVYQENVVKQYCVDDVMRLMALMNYFKENGVDVGDVKVTERLGI